MRRASAALIAISLLALFASAAEPLAPWPPRGAPLRVPVTRDTWVSSCSGETQGNNGGANTLKTKAYQEFALLDFDPAPLKGRTVTGALLHLHCASKDIQKRLTVSSLASEWVEGTGSGYAKQPGTSCFEEAELGKRPWAYPGSDITAVAMGEGNTLWATWDATPPDAEGWQTVAVDPKVIAARIAGISHGFVVFDDTGSEWTRNGESFTMHIFPNRFVHSRDSGEKTAPYFTLYFGDDDKQPPDAPSDIRVEHALLPAGEAVVSWATPGDRGAAGTFGFDARVFEGAKGDWDEATPVPRYLIPLANTNQQVEMHLRDLPLKPGASVTIGVRAIDAAGNVGPVATGSITLSGTPKTIALAGAPAPKFTEAAPLPKLGNAEVFVIDPLDKVNPVSGETIPSHDATYLAANHLWSAKNKLVRLYAAKNEFVAFQIVLKGAAAGVTPAIKLPEPLRGELLEFHNVKSKSGPLPDPLVPVKGALASGAFLADLYVPHDAKAGKHTGTLTLTKGGESLSLAIELNVWDFTLPDYLSFLPEMNSYGLPAPPAEAGYYRVAHAHRTCVNALPYSQGGSVRHAPKWDGQKLDWADWDRHFSPYLDGSAFSDLPRKGIPVDSFYLPLHENWPGNVFKDYNGSYWADRAFPPDYREAFVKVAGLMAGHFAEKGWNDTFLQFYLNNKNNFKQRGWSRGASPWILDEPASFQDYWALRWFAAAFHEAAAARGKTKLGFRLDISRPEWERDLLAPLNDFYICSGVFRKYRRMILDRQRRNGMVIFEYGSSNRIEDSNVQPAGWCVSAWCLGADGVLPWQTIGDDSSWANADECSLFYPGGKVNSPEPIPSVRLKAYRRGQQDVEYLTLLTQHLKAPRWAVGQAVQEHLRLVASAQKGPDVGGIEDAGRIAFRDLSPVTLWELRTQVGGILSKARPEPKRRLVDLRPPARDVSKLPTFLPEPRPPVAEKGAAAEPEPGEAIIIQGKPAVADALIAFDAPDRNHGGVPRDNALRRAERSNAFLVKFDLPGAKLPAGAKIASARLSFFVWDPSSKGKSHVCAYRITSADWDERTVTWRQAAAGKTWADEGGFEVGKDTPKEPEGDIIVPPDDGADTVDPPLEYSIDITKAVQAWASGQARNYGLALVPTVDRAVDDGQWTRFQLLASEHNQKEFTPKLTIRLAK